MKKQKLELLKINSIWYHPLLDVFGIVEENDESLYNDARCILHHIDGCTFEGRLFADTVQQAKSHGWKLIDKG